MAADMGFLSQEEIDSLLSAISSETEAETPPAPANAAAAPLSQSSAEQPKRYDFRRPDRFSKEQIRALRMIHETWARRVSVSLSAFLRTSVEVNLADVDQGMYTSLVQQIPDQGVYYIISLLPLPGHFLLHMSLDLAMVIIDRMMGGPGLTTRSDRGVTDLEFELLGVTTNKILSDLQAAWSSTASLRPRIDDISLNLFLIPVALPTDALVWASFEVRIKGTTSSMILGLPYTALKPVAGNLSPYVWIANSEAETRESTSVHHQDLLHTLGKTSLPVSCMLGSTSISLEELASLQIGDVLMLDAGTDALCPVLINGYPKFLGQPGLVRRKLAVQLATAVEGAEPAQSPEPTIAGVNANG